MPKSVDKQSSTIITKKTCNYVKLTKERHERVKQIKTPLGCERFTHHKYFKNQWCWTSCR